jgi:hypothetical protein
MKILTEIKFQLISLPTQINLRKKIKQYFIYMQIMSIRSKSSDKFVCMLVKNKKKSLSATQINPKNKKK